MIEKDIEYSGEIKYLEIHREKANDFRVFVQIENTIQERTIVLTATDDHRVFHYNGSLTAQRETLYA